MKSSSFYDLTAVSFSDRETFNNAILLLSMVKSEAYYIIGFSRPDKTIEIGVDYQDLLNTTITQAFTMDLNNPCRIYFKSVFKDVDVERCEKLINNSDSNFYIYENDFVYESFIERDEVIPISIENVDIAIKKVKKDIISFIEEYLG